MVDLANVSFTEGLANKQRLIKKDNKITKHLLALGLSAMMCEKEVRQNLFISLAIL